MAEGSDIPVGAAFDAWRLRALGAAEAAALDPRALLEYCACLGLLAPTTHNTVPQRIRISAAQSQMAFALDRRVILAESDPTGRQATISLGASIANVTIGAEAAGVSVSTSVYEVDERSIRPAAAGTEPIVPIASVTFDRQAARGTTRSIEWVRAILTRKMVRAEFDERVRLDPSLASELASIVAAHHPGLSLHVITDAPTLLALGKFQELADSTVINRVPFARELADWLVENDSDWPLGMRGREFGLKSSRPDLADLGVDVTSAPERNVLLGQTVHRGVELGAVVQEVEALTELELRAGYRVQGRPVGLRHRLRNECVGV